MRKMVFIRKYAALLLLVLLCACAGKESSVKMRVLDNGVMVKNLPASGEALCLQVVKDDIIRVMAKPSGKIDKQAGPMCAYDASKSAAIQVNQQNDTLVLSTSAMRAELSLSTGRLAFYDAAGNLLLQEPEQGARQFQAKWREDKKDYYELCQRFLSPEDEAFYGLGQHQSGEMNYKNKHERLYQYNTKVSVPFVVSNKHYGILWDNYAYSKWGDPREFEQIDCFRLYDKNMQEGALTASYIPRNDVSKTLERRESQIAY